jgi:hypothetical protein
VHKVFLIVPTGVNGHAEVGCIRKLDLEDLGFFLGHDDVYHRNVRNGQPTFWLEGQFEFSILWVLTHLNTTFNVRI